MKESLHTDLELLNLVAGGNELAFTEIFYRYSNGIYHYSLKLVHSKFFAEEVVQNVFLQLWQQRATLSLVENPKAYIFRMAANRSIDMMRAQEKQIRTAYQLNHREEYNCTPDNNIDIKEMENMLREAIHRLPQKRKLIYHLRNSEGLSYDEISQHLQVSRHTVRNQLAKAVETIRDYLVSQGVSLVAILLFFPS